MDVLIELCTWSIACVTRLHDICLLMLDRSLFCICLDTASGRQHRLLHPIGNLIIATKFQSDLNSSRHTDRQVTHQ